jgi:hypothetical protein
MNFSFSRFFCTECGNESMPIYRPKGKMREAGHLKKLYCLYCKKEVNHAEVREIGGYTEEDFRKEFELGRFVNGQRLEGKDLPLCSNTSCPFNIKGKCWNSNNSKECPYKPKGVDNNE